MTSPGEYNGIGYSRYGYSMLTNLCGTPKYALGVQAVAPVYQIRGISPATQSSVSYSGVDYKNGFTCLFAPVAGSYHGHPDSSVAYSGASGENSKVQTFSVTRTAQ